MILLARMAILIDDSFHRVADGHRAVGKRAAMHDTVGDLFGGLDDKLAVRRFNLAAIADLSARFGIEAGLVENKPDIFIRCRSVRSSGTLAR